MAGLEESGFGIFAGFDGGIGCFSFGRDDDGKSTVVKMFVLARQKEDPPR